MERKRASDQAEDAMPYSSVMWWSCEEGTPELTNRVWGWAERLKSRHRRRALLDALWEAVYKDTPLNQLDADYGTVIQRARKARQNIAKNMVDTVTARLAKRRPLPTISADNAGFTEKLFAKRSSRILARKMRSTVVERMRPLVIRDAVIRGSGVWKAFRSGGDVDVERVPRREILADPVEAQYGSTRTLAQCKRMDRGVLLGMFPDRHLDICSLAKASFDDWRVLWEDSSDVDHVDVIEAWHLPSVRGGTDGRHVICVRGFPPLLDEPWKRQRFPFSFFHWEPPIDGFWGVGLIEALAPIQMEVNQLLGTMGEGIAAQMALKILTQRGAGVEKSHLRAGHPVVIEYDGMKPEWQAPLPFNPAVLEYIQWRIQQAYEVSGISQASAASKNPLGANASGKALDTMYDIESDRFGDKELGYAMASVDLGICILDEARALAEDEDVEESDKAAWIRENDWEKVDIDSGEYNLVPEPTNFLPDARGGKLAHVREMADTGLLSDPLEAAALFDEPDIARANRHLLGPYRMLERWCEELADVTVPIETLTPTPLTVAHSALATKMAMGELCNVIYEGADDAVQSRFRWALKVLDAETRAAAPAAPAVPPVDPMAGAPPAGAPPMMPPGMPPGPMPGEMPMPMDPAMAAAMSAAPPMPTSFPGNGMGGLDAMAAAGIPLPAPQGMI
jgi:hypothetical protein